MQGIMVERGTGLRACRKHHIILAVMPELAVRPGMAWHGMAGTSGRHATRNTVR